MKLNSDKCHLLILERNSNQQVTLNIRDEKFTFDTHISKLCKRFALALIAGYIDPNKLIILIRAFVIS